MGLFKIAIKEKTAQRKRNLTYHIDTFLNPLIGDALFNASRHLPTVLSDLQMSSDWEIILVDDGSEDEAAFVPADALSRFNDSVYRLLARPWVKAWVTEATAEALRQLLVVLAAGGAVAVVVSGNIVRMAFYLILSLGAVAGLFFLAGVEFLGAMQLMIYVGGTLVLLVFGVMLTGQGPFANLKTGGGQWVLAAVVGGSRAVA